MVASQASSRWSSSPCARPEEASESSADLRLVSGGSQFDEGQSEEHVAGLRGCVAAVLGVDGGLATAQIGVVEHVVVHERGHVHQLDCGARADQCGFLLGRGFVDRAAGQDQQRAQPLAAGAQRCQTRGGGAGLARLDDLGQALLDIGKPRGDALADGCGQGLERARVAAHGGRLRRRRRGES